MQKGVPILTLPLIVKLFGRNTFGQYVLILTIVQVYAMISSIAVPQAIVPLWFRQADRIQFMQNSLLLLGALAVVVGGAAVLAVPLIEPHISLPLPKFASLAWVLVFALFYNLNQLGIAGARLQGRPARFFAASVAGSVALLIGLGVAKAVGITTLQGLLFIQVVSVAVSGVLLLGRQLIFVPKSGTPSRPAQWAAIIRLSLPLFGYALLVLASQSADKWVARGWFDRDVFNTYVLDYQFAFSIMFIPIAIGLYNGPRISAFVASGDGLNLKSEERRGRWLNISGSVVMALSIYAYAAITNVPLSAGFWVLAAGFLCEGQFVLRSNRLMAELKSSRLFAISAIGVPLLLVLLAIAAASNSVVLLYLSVPSYLFAMMLMAAIPTTPKRS